PASRTRGARRRRTADETTLPCWGSGRSGRRAMPCGPPWRRPWTRSAANHERRPALPTMVLQALGPGVPALRRPRAVRVAPPVEESRCVAADEDHPHDRRRDLHRSARRDGGGGDPDDGRAAGADVGVIHPMWGVELKRPQSVDSSCFVRVVASVSRLVSAAAQSAEIVRFFAARVTSLPSFLSTLAALRTKPFAFLEFAAFCAPRSIRPFALSNSWVIDVGIA